MFLISFKKYMRASLLLSLKVGVKISFSGENTVSVKWNFMGYSYLFNPAASH